MAGTSRGGGLLNLGGNSTYINLALQALLHCPELMKVLKSDVWHIDCEAGCWTCDVLNICLAVQEGNVGNALCVVNKYNRVSCNMQAAVRNEPYEILLFFLSKLRLEYLERVVGNETLTLQVYHAAPISCMFEVECENEVLCTACGRYPKTEFVLGIRIKNWGDSLEGSVMQHLSEDKLAVCSKCTQECVLKRNVSKFPPILIIHSYRHTADPTGMKISPLLNVGGHKYVLQSCIGTDTMDFYGVISGGQHLEHIKNSKVVQIKLGSFIMGNVMTNCRLTFIYAREVVSTPQVMPTDSSAGSQLPHPNRRLPTFEVMSYPKSGVDLFSDMPEIDKIRFRDIGCQNTVPTKDFSAQTSIEEPFLNYKKCKVNPKFNFFTGLSVEDFEALHDLIGGPEVILNLKMFYKEATPKKLLRHRHSRISSHDRLLLFFLRLRRGYPLEDLSVGFGISTSYAGELFYVMTRLLFLTLKELEDAVFVSAKRQAKSKPAVMRAFKNLRVILDGASFYIETPSNFEQQGNCFSKYKAHDVLLHILGCSCHGSTIFCSPSFEGSISDKEAILKSNLFDKLSRMDSIMTDRGFELTSECIERGVHLYKPPSKGMHRKSLTAEEEILTKAIAAARIYIEHVVADVKDNRLLRGVAPLTMEPIHGQLVFIAAYMRNFQEKRIHTKRPRAATAEETGEDL